MAEITRYAFNLKNIFIDNNYYNAMVDFPPWPLVYHTVGMSMCYGMYMTMTQRTT